MNRIKKVANIFRNLSKLANLSISKGSEMKSLNTCWLNHIVEHNPFYQQETPSSCHSQNVSWTEFWIELNKLQRSYRDEFPRETMVDDYAIIWRSPILEKINHLPCSWDSEASVSKRIWICKICYKLFILVSWHYLVQIYKLFKVK